MRTRNRTRAALAGLALVASAQAALAGPGDSPVPSISATGTTRVMFVVPGVIKNNGIETAFMCTSLDTATATVAIEVFAPEGGAPLNDVSTAVGNGTFPMPPGSTITMSTGTSVGLHEDETISGLTNVKNGSARILATTSQVLCTAILVEKNSATPGTLATLKIFARRKQNGD